MGEDAGSVRITLEQAVGDLSASNPAHLEHLLKLTPEQVGFLYSAWQRRQAAQRRDFVQDVAMAVSGLLSGTDSVNNYIDALTRAAGGTPDTPAGIEEALDSNGAFSY